MRECSSRFLVVDCPSVDPLSRDRDRDRDRDPGAPSQLLESPTLHRCPPLAFCPLHREDSEEVFVLLLIIGRSCAVLAGPCSRCPRCCGGCPRPAAPPWPPSPHASSRAVWRSCSAETPSSWHATLTFLSYLILSYAIYCAIPNLT